jgi:hypothetical protein
MKKQGRGPYKTKRQIKFEGKELRNVEKLFEISESASVLQGLKKHQTSLQKKLIAREILSRIQSLSSHTTHQPE